MCVFLCVCPLQILLSAVAMADPSSAQTALPSPDASPSSPSSSSPIVWFDRLADVEAQCVMTFCSAPDLLHLARTCRRLHHLADAPFPWRHLLHDLGVTPVDRWGHHEHRGLISHAPLGLAFCVFPPASSKEKWSLSLEALISHPLPNRLHRLDAGEASSMMQSIHWVLVLASPQVSQLRVLVIHNLNSSCKISKDLMASIVALRYLHTLHIAPAGGTGSRLAELAACPALTSLTVRDLPNSALRHLNGCLGLVRLFVSAPALYRSGNLFDLFEAPYASRLEQLTIDAGLLTNPNQSSWAPVFFALKSLRTLRLQHCRDMDAILPHLWNAPLLREVAIRVDFAASQQHLPSVGALAQMLASSNRIFLRLESVVTNGSNKDQRQAAGYRIEMAEELEPFRDRISVVHTWQPLSGVEMQGVSWQVSQARVAEMERAAMEPAGNRTQS